MNIQEILGGQVGSQLGPVEIKQVYESKTVGSGTAKRGILIEDASGKTIVNLMGPAANGNFSAGESITLQAMGDRGKIEANEYQGKFSITAWSCQVVKNTSAGSERQQSNQTHYQSNASSNASPSATRDLKADRYTADELAREIWTMVDALGRTANEFPNIPDAIKDQVMARGGDLGPLWWFGERGIRHS